MIFERLNNIFLRAEVVDTTLLRNNPLRSHKQLEGISRKQSNLHVSNVILKFELGGDAGASNAIGKSYECRSSRHYGCKEEDGAACVTMHGGCFCFVLEEPAVLVLRRVVAQSHLSSPKHMRQRVSANISLERVSCQPAPTRHLGANKGYALKLKCFIIENHTFLSTTKCRVGAVPKIS